MDSYGFCCAVSKSITCAICIWSLMSDYACAQHLDRHFLRSYTTILGVSASRKLFSLPLTMPKLITSMFLQCACNVLDLLGSAVASRG